MTSRIMSGYSRPLESKALDLHFINSLNINHWALVIGEPPELFVELYATPNLDTGLLKPLNKFRYLENRHEIDQELKRFARFATWTKTTKTNQEIIEKAAEIIKRNPYYSVLSWNCQHFVDTLRWGITIRNVRGWVERVSGRSHKGDSENLELVVDYETDMWRKALVADEFQEIIPTPNPIEFERNRLQIEAVDKFFVSQGLPQIDILLGMWAIRQYADMPQRIEETGGVEVTPEL